MRIVTALAAALVLAGSAHAQPQPRPQPQTQLIKCGNASTQTDLNLCADQAYRKSDAELNTAYRTVTERLKDDQTTLAKLLSLIHI